MDKNTAPKSKVVQLFKDWFCLSVFNISLSFFSNSHEYLSSGLLDKLGLLSSDSANRVSLDEINKSSFALRVDFSTNLAAGIYSGFTGRYFLPNVFFMLGFIPEIADASNGGDFWLNTKRVIAKTAVVYGGWALGKIGKKAYDFGKEIYKLNTNRDGAELFEHYK